MNRGAYRKAQRGVALWLLLFGVILAGGFAYYRTANFQFNRLQQESKLAATMAKAKEALIARAVTDDNRPGSLPCPDRITNSSGLSNVPGDGKTDFFTMTQCPTYVGWLPWVTLDLPELTDDTGTRLWYVLAPGLRDDDSAQPINSDTATGLELDGNSDIAALIIAPGGALAGQSRPSHNLADYLDGANGNADDHRYISGTRSDAFNDVVLVITRQELMAAVEKRVASELRSCLIQHASASANSSQRYPWPAPFSATARQGKTGAHFGYVPATQPGSGPEQMLQESKLQLTTLQSSITNASDLNQQLAGAKELAETLAFAQNFFDQLYVTTKSLRDVALTSDTALGTLNATITSAVLNGRISRTERTNIRTQSSPTISELTNLQSTLTASGIDVFPTELSTLTKDLQNALNTVIAGATASNLSALQGKAQSLTTLLAQSTTSNGSINPSLSTNLASSTQAATAALNAASAPSDTALLNAATTASQSLLGSLATLQATIKSNRVSVNAAEISGYHASLNAALSQFSSNQSATTATTLAEKLATTKTWVSTIATGSTAVVSQQSTSVTALTAALSAAQAATDFKLIDSSTQSALTALNQLNAIVATNGDNLTQASLAAAIADYSTEQNTFATYTAPTQSQMVPYAQRLQAAAVDVEFWTEIIARNATNIAIQAKADPTTGVVSASSAFQTAANTQASLSGSTGTLSTLQDYLNRPTSTSAQSNATAALNNTLNSLNDLLASTRSLEASLSSSSAAAFPTIWYSSRCGFIQDSASWWSSNQWTNLAFYQIGNIQHSANPGTLKVNGAGSHEVVILAAGRALGSQNRATLSSVNFFEGINADTSRNGDALSPASTFVSAPLSNLFNDRLSF